MAKEKFNRVPLDACIRVVTDSCGDYFPCMYGNARSPEARGDLLVQALKWCRPNDSLLLAPGMYQMPTSIRERTVLCKPGITIRGSGAGITKVIFACDVPPPAPLNPDRARDTAHLRSKEALRAGFILSSNVLADMSIEVRNSDGQIGRGCPIWITGQERCSVLFTGVEVNSEGEFATVLGEAGADIELRYCIDRGGMGIARASEAIDVQLATSYCINFPADELALS